MFFYFHLYVMMLSTFVVSNVDVGLLSPAAAVAEDEKVLSCAVEFSLGPRPSVYFGVGVGE